MTNIEIVERIMLDSLNEHRLNPENKLYDIIVSNCIEFNITFDELIKTYATWMENLK